MEKEVGSGEGGRKGVGIERGRERGRREGGRGKEGRRVGGEGIELLVCWVHLSWGVFSTVLKLSIRSRSITAVHLALNSHMNAIWRSHRHALLLLTGETLSASRKPP